MKPRLLLVFFVALLLALPGRAEAEGPVVPHRDLARVTSRINSALPVGYLGDHLDYLINAQRLEAQQVFQRALASELPPGMRFVVQQFGASVAKLIEGLNKAEEDLGQAVRLLDLGNREAAKTYQDSADGALAEAKTTVQELWAATEVLDNRLRPLAPETEAFGEAFDRLLRLVDRISAIHSQYERSLAELRGGPLTPALAGVRPRVSLSFDVPGEALPGRDLSVDGRVTHLSGPAGTSVSLWLMVEGVVVSEFSTEGSFHQSFTLRPDTPEGTQVLSLVLDPAAPYAATSVSRRVIVRKAVPDYALDAPRILFFPRSVALSGIVTPQLSLPSNSSVTVEFGEKTRVLSPATDGGFSTAIGVSQLRLFLGPQPYQVVIAPGVPWYRSVEQQGGVFIVNGVSVALLFPLVVGVFILLSMGWRRLRTLAASPSGAVGSDGRASSAISALVAQEQKVGPSPSGSLTEARTRIVAAYEVATQDVLAKQGVQLRLSFTLRDVATAVRAGAGTPFAMLTRLAEQALYAGDEPPKTEVEQAEQLSRQVMEA